MGFVSLLAVCLLSSCGSRSDSAKAEESEIEVLCAAGLRVPVEEAARVYEAEGLGRVRLEFGGSQTLLSKMEVSKKGAVFLPADLSYIEIAKKKNLVAEQVELTVMNGVVGVKKGNPAGVHSLADLQKDGVRVVLANPELAAISNLTSKALPAAVWQALTSRAVAMKPTVSDAANDIVLGAADAGFVWDVTVLQTAGLEKVELPELAAVKGRVAGAVCVAGSNQTAALRFLRWLSSPEKGGPILSKHGYAAPKGDAWVKEPALTVYAGAMLRPAIDQTISEFEKREGCRVDRVYNGCGILLAQMQSAVPDVFFSCDVSFMDQVSNLFPNAKEISSNQLVILVKKGNPHKIRTLEDLGKSGIRVGVGNEKQCALGVITQTTLKESGWRDAVTKNVVVQAPAGDLLVNQLLAGGLDAAVTYISNAAGSAEQLEAMPISMPCAIAKQPLAVGKNAKFPQLAARLTAALTTAESRQKFEALGFGWKKEAATAP